MNMEEYSELVRKRFFHPHHAGEIEDADGTGAVGDPDCGDYTIVWIKVKDGRLESVRFKCRGCPAAIACMDMTCELVEGLTVEEASRITEEIVVESLGGLPESKEHCSNLGALALRKAIDDYLEKRRRKFSEQNSYG